MYQPISYQEMADFATRVLRLPDHLLRLFYTVIEETDNGVMYDRWAKESAALEKLKAENAGKPKPKKPRSKVPRK